MRVVPQLLMTVLLGLGLTGCSLFKKSGSNGEQGPYTPPPSQVPPPKFPTGGPAAAPSSDPLNGQSKTDAAGNSLLAGRVLDGVSRPPGGTSIRVVNADTKDENAGRDVNVSPEGYFTIENLKPGGQYKLIARGKQGERLVAGIHYATAPNVRVLIQVREDLVTSTTPSVLTPFGSLKDEKKPETFTKEATPAPSKNSWQTGGIDASASQAEFTLPAVNVPSRPEIAGLVNNGGAWIPPTLEIKAPRPVAPEFAKIAPNELPPPPKAATNAPENLGPAKVPSCVLVGRTLVNFALNDINGETWEFKTSRKGKMVLLDFWGTWCVPCRQTMPALKGLQQRYGTQGLEVVGIAYEQGGTPQEQAYKVNDVCQKLLVNYRQLLGSGPNCVVKTQLGVRAYPTLILLDETGTILWRHEGRPSSVELEELDRLIQSRLRVTTAF